jgi:hypothetical protein
VLRAVSLALVATAALPAAARAFQARQPRDTVTPHYGRWGDELPAMLATAASVMQSGLEADTRATILAELRALAPTRPLEMREPSPRKSYELVAGFRGRQVPFSLFMYWPDTSGVAFRVRSSDLALVDAVDSALYTMRVSQLARPDTIRFTVGDFGGGSDGRPSSISVELSVPQAKHCPWFGLEHSLDWSGDTLRVHVYGVAPPGTCPSGAYLKGSQYAKSIRPGTRVVAFDFRGDTDYVSLIVTDSSVALRPIRTSFVHAEPTVKWRFPSSVMLLECHRLGGDTRLCDALHEWVQRQPGVRRLQAPSGIAPVRSSSDGLRKALYRYPNEEVGTAVRRCIASISQRDRLASWVKLQARTADGTWRVEQVYGTSTIRDGQPAMIAAVLDETGSIPARCGDAAAPTLVQAPAAAPPRPARRTLASAPRITPVTVLSDEHTEPTGVEARSDGWIAITPLISVFAPEPYPTTHLYARAADALKWVERVRAALQVQPDTGRDASADSFVPQLGVGRVHIEVHPSPGSSDRSVLSYGLEDCTGMHRQYGNDRATLLGITAQVERAARIALAGSRVAVPPSVDDPYYSREVSCRAMPRASNAPARFPDDVPVNQRRFTELGVRFVVDTAGRVDPASVAILSGTSPSLAAATRALVGTWRYRAAEWGGVPVRQFVSTVVAFDPATSPAVPSSSTARASHASIAPIVQRPGAHWHTMHYPLRVAAPAGVAGRRSEVLASVVVDSTGTVDPRTLLTMPGTDSRVVDLMRGQLADLRFTPATNAGARVAERITRVWLVDPELSCPAEDAGPDCPLDNVALAAKTTPPIPTALLRPSTFYDVRAEVAPLDESALLPAVLGVPMLKTSVLPRSVREIRIYTGLVIGYPHAALVVREEGGRAGKVTGRLVQYWPVNDTVFTKEFDSDALYTAAVAGRCDTPRRSASAVACTVRFPRQPDWRALLRELDAVNAFTLPDGSQVPSRGMTIDGRRVRVESRRGTTYHQYEYHNPEVYRSPEGPNALRVMSIVDSLFRLATPPRALQHVRGIYLYGRDTSDFVRCGRPEKPGYFQGQLGPIARLVGDSAWRARPSPSRAFMVEAWVRRRQVDEELPNRRFYPRTWQVDSVTAVKAVTSRGC